MESPSYNQLAYTFQMLAAEALHDTNNHRKSGYYYSSAEALGDIRKQYVNAEATLLKTNIVAGEALDENSLESRKTLTTDLAGLAASCMRAALTLCDMSEEAGRINEIMRQSQIISDVMRGTEDADS